MYLDAIRTTPAPTTSESDVSKGAIPGPSATPTREHELASFALRALAANGFGDASL